MEMTDAHTDDLSPLDARRAELRDLHDRILEATKALPMPQSHAEADRAFRCVASADRALIQIYSKASLKTLRAWSPRTPGTPVAATAEPDDFEYIYDDDVEGEPASPPLRGACAAAGEVAARCEASKLTEGADPDCAMAPTVCSHSLASHGSRELYSRVAHTPAAASGLAREESAEERANAREKAFAHLDSLLEKAARLTGGMEEAEPLPVPPFRPVASKPARATGPSIRIFPP